MTKNISGKIINRLNRIKKLLTVEAPDILIINEMEVLNRLVDLNILKRGGDTR
jgi:DNA-directed RNA polymerase beta' subunit